jgi:hypothetical protein
MPNENWRRVSRRGWQKREPLAKGETKKGQPVILRVGEREKLKKNGEREKKGNRWQKKGQPVILRVGREERERKTEKKWGEREKPDCPPKSGIFFEPASYDFFLCLSYDIVETKENTLTNLQIIIG